MIPVSNHALAVCLCPAMLEPNGYLYALVSSSVFISRTFVASSNGTQYFPNQIYVYFKQA